MQQHILVFQLEGRHGVVTILANRAPALGEVIYLSPTEVYQARQIRNYIDKNSDGSGYRLNTTAIYCTEFTDATNPFGPTAALLVEKVPTPAEKPEHKMRNTVLAALESLGVQVIPGSDLWRMLDQASIVALMSDTELTKEGATKLESLKTLIDEFDDFVWNSVESL